MMVRPIRTATRGAALLLALLTLGACNRVDTYEAAVHKNVITAAS